MKTLDLVEKFLESEWKKEVSSLVEHFEDTRLGRLQKNQHFLRIDGSLQTLENVVRLWISLMKTVKSKHS